MAQVLLMQIQVTSPFELQADPSSTDLGQMLLPWPSHLSIFASVYHPLSATLSSIVGRGGEVGVEVCIPCAFPSKTQLWVLPPPPFSNTRYPKTVSSIEDWKLKEVN